MESYISEIILFVVGSTLLVMSLNMALNLTVNTTTVAQSRMIVDSFSDAINYLYTSYDGAEYTVVNPNLLACGLRYGLKNLTTEKNVPYITIYCPGHVEKTFYHVKLSVNSTGVLDSKYIYVYRVGYDGNLTIFIRT